MKTIHIRIEPKQSSPLFSAKKNQPAYFAHIGKSMNAELTTDHAASSYGLPVLVAGGVAYGPADIGEAHLSPANLQGEDHKEWAAGEREQIAAWAGSYLGEIQIRL